MAPPPRHLEQHARFLDVGADRAVTISDAIVAGGSLGVLQMVRAAVAFFLSMLLPSIALAQKRVALVIGNSAYEQTSKLTNPTNDARDMAASLKRHGFQVIEGLDLDKPAFDRKVRDFATALKGSDAGVFFYAGHGLQVAGQNYLVPIDAKAEGAEALEFEMVRVEVIHRIMERQTNTNILFLDACRDNPLARNLARSMGTRSSEIGKGLAAVESGVGTLISFSTQPGNVALDGTGRNSPFAGALVKQLSSTNDDLSAILIAVRNEVMKETQRKQVPWEHSALTGRFYFNPTAQTAEPTKIAPARLSEAAEAWNAVKDSTSNTALEAYITRFKDTFYAELARQRIEELKKQQVAVAEPPKSPLTVPAPAARPSTSPPTPFTLASPLTLKLQDTFPTKDTSSRDPLNAVVQELTSRSGSTLKVDVLPAGAVVPAFAALDAVHKGVLDAAWTVPVYWYGKSRTFALFSGMIPGGLEPAAFVRWMEAEGSAEANRLLSESLKMNVRSLPCGLIGPGGEWFKKAVWQIDDFKGLKFRTVGLPMEVATAIGTATNALPGGEIVAAMDRGLLDASDWSSPESAIVLGFPDVSKTLHYPGWTRPVHLLELIINETAWGKLGRNGQAGLEAACRRNLHRSLDRIPELERKGLDDLRKSAVNVQPYPPAVLQKIKEASQKVLDRFAKEDAGFARVLASYEKYR
jgi:TRAP-type mannitol/chloroaromatic compound transport system substrate-binding protein/uncharacterized caspase-like protein